MTTETTTDEETTEDTPAETVDTADEPTDETAAADNAEPDTGNSEAAKYRRKLREAEAANQALSEQVAGFQRNGIERLVGERLEHASDFWLDGPDIGELVGDDGQPNVEAINARVDGLLEQRPHWKKPPAPFPDLGQGFRSAAAATPSSDWLQVMTGLEN